MLGCIDCIHWKWKNCPLAWHGQFKGHYHDPTIILEVVCGLARFWDQNTLWHIMTTCVIMRNMIIENKQGQSKDFNYNYMGTHMRPEMNRPNQEIFGNTSKDRRLCNT